MLLKRNGLAAVDRPHVDHLHRGRLSGALLLPRVGEWKPVGLGPLVSSAITPKAAGTSPVAKLAYAPAMISLFVAISSPLLSAPATDQRSLAHSLGIGRLFGSQG
jgi:hypothetical protein